MIKLHQNKVIVNEDKLLNEGFCSKRVAFAAHEFELVIRQTTHFSVCCSIKHLNLVCKAIDVDVVMERGRQEVHWNAPIKSAERLVSIHDLAGLLVKLEDLEYAVLLVVMLHHNQVIVTADIDVLVFVINQSRILCNFLVGYNLHTKVLILRVFLDLPVNYRSVSEGVHLLEAFEAVF